MTGRMCLNFISGRNTGIADNMFDHMWQLTQYNVAKLKVLSCIMY